MVLILRQDVVQAVRVYNTKSDQKIFIRLLRKPINTTTIQIYASTTDAEDEMEHFSAFRRKLIIH